MKEHPILFSGEMVRSLLARRKTQTRRLSESWMKVKAGDRLWVREMWCSPETVKHGASGRVGYNADAECGYMSTDGDFIRHGRILEAESYRLPTRFKTSDTVSLKLYGGKWRPSIHMPRWASRVTLEATADARRERLQDISDEDCFAEGIQSVADEGKSHGDGSARGVYKALWDSLHGKDAPWASNPLVTVISFRVLP